MYASNHLANHLRAASVGHESRLFAELTDGRRHTYGELFAAANKIAAALVAAGVAPGDRVAVQVDKSIEALQLYLGTILAGGVFLPLNTAYTANEIEYFLDNAEPAVFVCDPEKLNALDTIASKAGVQSVFTLHADGTGTLMEAAARQPDDFAAIARKASDLAAILYTSGTTGRSKGAMLTHENLASNSATLKDYWAFSDKDVLIHALPIFHTHGLFVATNVALTAGSSLIFMPQFDASRVVAALSRATVLMGVPTFYVRLLAHPDISPATVKNMRLFVSGSAPLRTETHNDWRRRTGHAILERYGMTETNMITSNPYDGERRAGTVGLPLPDVEVRITDPDSHQELPRGEVGAIEVRGPNVFKGYWRMPEKTAEELQANGFFLTGDIGVIDEKGYVSIVGRSKDLIITGGYNVYPKEIESLIDEIAGVAESAVIGLPHPDFGEAVAALVVLEPGVNLSAEQITTVLTDKIARFKQPKITHFINELPRNTMGKVQKNRLRDQYAHAFDSKPGTT